jgi:phosphoglycolate phosphatase-like HAD superfamily hydrolase
MHLIWDWNGTLFDDNHIVVDAVNASLTAITVGVQIDADGYRDHYQRPVRAFYDVLLGRGVTDAEWDTINTTFHDEYMDMLHLAAPATDALSAATYAVRRRLTQSILSMWTHELLVPTVAGHGLAEMMVAVRGSDTARGDRKEDLLARHLDELPMNGDIRTVLIGDTFDDAAAAEALGIGCVFYNGGSHHRPELVATGVPVADTLVEAIDLAADL